MMDERARREFLDQAAIDIYDHEKKKVIDTISGIQTKWALTRNTEDNMRDMCKEIQDKLYDVGFVAHVFISREMIAESLGPEVTIIGRVNVEQETDHDRLAWEIRRAKSIGAAYDGEKK